MVPSTSLIPIRDNNPTRSFSYVTVTLIVVNVLVWLQEPSLGSGDSIQLQTFFYRWGVVPREIATGDPLRFAECAGACKVVPPFYSIFTAMFLHGGFLHLAGNMLFLWVFGNNIEDTVGSVKFLVFYLFCGVMASLAHVAVNSGSTVPSVGASGAIAGMLGAYIVLFPRARVTNVVPIFFFQLIELPAMIVLGYWFISQFFIGFTQPFNGGGVAWMAHVGGFLTGALTMYGYRAVQRSRLQPPSPPVVPW